VAVILGWSGRRWLLAADVVGAVAIGALAAFRAPFGWVPGSLLAVALAAPLTVRRRWPSAVLVAVVLVGAAAIVAGSAGDAVVFAVAWALYPVALVSARSAAWGLAGALAGVLGAGLAVGVFPGLPPVPAPVGAESFATTPLAALAYCAVLLTGTWALATVVRVRRRHAVQLAEVRTGRAVAEERLRIARDIHDVVGHTLSLIAMKAAVATHLGDGAAALRTIERVSRAALDDVRTVLDALRDPADGPPSLTELDRLVDDTRSAGVTVTVTADPAALARVPAVVQASAYRIVQEALTNVRRHAGPVGCHLTVAVEPGTLAVSVVDDGAAARVSGPPGHGLLGMRERVALHGGTLRTGPEPGGGFAVRATLPFTGPVVADGD
jgi:signal transduction histidine kinase